MGPGSESGAGGADFSEQVASADASKVGEFGREDFPGGFACFAAFPHAAAGGAAGKAIVIGKALGIGRRVMQGEQRWGGGVVGLIDGQGMQPAGGRLEVPGMMAEVGRQLLEGAPGVGQEEDAGGVGKMGGVIGHQPGEGPRPGGGFGAGNDSAPVAGHDGLDGQVGAESIEVSAVAVDDLCQPGDFVAIEIHAIMAAGAVAAREFAAAQRLAQRPVIDDQLAHQIPEPGQGLGKGAEGKRADGGMGRGR